MNRKNLRLEGNGNNDKSYERNGYPIESISESLKNLTKIQKETNYQQRINKESIGKVLNKKVDLVSSNGLSPYIKPLVENEKQLVYAR